MKNLRFVLMMLLFATILFLMFPNTNVKSDPEWNVPEGLEFGDIIVMNMPIEVTIFGLGYPVYHVAMYTDGNNFIHIPGPGHTVENCTYDLFAKANWVNPHTIRFYNVTVNEEVKWNALGWILNRQQENCQYQLWLPLNISGKTISEKLNSLLFHSFQFDSISPLRKIADINLTSEGLYGDKLDSSDKFYCAELIWAAYKSQDIEIDCNGWCGPFGQGCGIENWPTATLGIFNLDIIDSDTTPLREVEHKPYPPKKIGCTPGSYGNQNWSQTRWEREALEDGPYLEFKAYPYWNHKYKFKTVDINYDKVSMTVDWGDNTTSDWTDFQSDSERFVFYHKYTEFNQTYNVSVNCKDENNNFCEEKLIFTVNTTNWTPILVIGTNSENNTFYGSVGEEIQFNGTVAFGISPYSWVWDFGDGTEPTDGQNVTHAFDEPGVYSGRLSVQDASGTRDEINITTYIGGIRLKATPNPQLKGEQLTFTAEVVDVEHENNTFFVFNISGNNIETNNSFYQYTYEVSGTYQASVKVYDGQGGSLLGEDNVTVVIDPFTVDIGGPYSGIVNQTINFCGSVYGFKGDWQNAYWDFGDGSGAYGFNVSHKYTETFEGDYKNYTVIFTVYGLGQGGKETANDSSTIRIWEESFSPPVANITGPSCGSPGQTLIFDGTNSNGTNLTYMWKVSGGDWEEGNSTLNKAFYPGDHAIPSIYIVNLKVIDDQTNFSSVDTTSVLISELKANFIVPSNINDTSPVQFYGNSAPDGCSSITSWKWFFGDGSPYNTSKNPEHQYEDDGYYNVKLIVGSGGNYDSVTKTIYVQNIPPEAESSVDLRVAAVSDNITFNSTSYDVDGEISQSIWQFGDGAGFSENNTTYAYEFSGLYDISLQVIDNDYGTSTGVKEDYLLIADTIVSNDFDENSSGWNTTRFNDIQNAIFNTPAGGLLVILDGQYEIKDNITIGGPINICGIKDGYDSGDTEIEYGGVEIVGNDNLIGLTIIAPKVFVRGITFNNSATGVQIVHTKYFFSNCSYNFTDCTFLNCGFAANCTNTTNVTFYNCNFNNNNYGITCKNSSHIPICNSVISENEAVSITITNSDNVTIHDTEVSYSTLGIYIDSSVDNSITGCNISEIEQGIQLLNSSDDNTIQNCGFYHVDSTAVLINNSIGNVISDCAIVDGYKGVEVLDVDPDNQEPLLPNNMLNIILDTNFTNVDYGVYLFNSSHTRIGKQSWSFNERDAEVYLVYYRDETAMSPVVPFPSNLENATSLFAHNNYSIYIDYSDYNVVDGVAIAPVFVSQNTTPSSCNDGIMISNSENNVVASCLIQNANYSAINISDSSSNTVCLCMLKENQQGITAEDSNYNMFIGCSFFNNTFYGVELLEETMENSVIYNDFVYNNQSYYQAYDVGDSNFWDDDGSSFWRDLIGEGFGDEKMIGNFWSDYSNASFSENGTGMIPSNHNSSCWLPTGETPYNISGSSKSQDHAPILESIWAESWYVGDYPWLAGEDPYLLPPIPYE